VHQIRGRSEKAEPPITTLIFWEISAFAEERGGAPAPLLINVNQARPTGQTTRVFLE